MDIRIFNNNVGVESFFIRAVNEIEHNGFWIKFTLLKTEEGVKFKVWIIHFHEFSSIIKTKTYPFYLIEEEENGFKFPNGYVDFTKGSYGNIDGLSWDLSWKIKDDKPVILLPNFLYSNTFPNTKLITPYPKIIVDGTMKLDECLLVSCDLVGMIGHNWGPKHSREYNWFSVSSDLFYGEGFNVKICGIPFTSILIRHEEIDYVFSDIFDILKMDSKCNFMEWSVHTRISNNLKLNCIGNKKRAVKLNYYNPNGTKMECVNDNLAKIFITLRKGGEQISDGMRGTLEFLRKPI